MFEDDGLSASVSSELNIIPSTSMLRQFYRRQSNSNITYFYLADILK